jgi:hypothetical protein
MINQIVAVQIHLKLTILKPLCGLSHLILHRGVLECREDRPSSKGASEDIPINPEPLAGNGVRDSFRLSPVLSSLAPWSSAACKRMKVTTAGTTTPCHEPSFFFLLRLVVRIEALAQDKD